MADRRQGLIACSVSLPHRAPKPEPVFRERIVVMRGLPVFKMHAMREIAWGDYENQLYLPCPACLSLPSWVSPAVSPAVSDSKLERGRYSGGAGGTLRGLPHSAQRKGEPIRESCCRERRCPLNRLCPCRGRQGAQYRRSARLGRQNAVKFLMTGLAYNDLPGRSAHAAISFQRRGCDGRGGVLRSLAPSEGPGSEAGANDEAAVIVRAIRSSR